MCYGLSAQGIETALDAAKDQFHRGSEQGKDRTQCDDVVNKTVATLEGVKKKGKGALKKTENLHLQNEIDRACKELQKLQGRSGQVCFDFAKRWRYVISRF